MKIEMTSLWLPLLQPGLYGTNLGNMFEQIFDEDEIKEDFQSQICHQYESIMNEIFNEDWFVDTFGNIVVNNCVFKSPQYYNFENDSIEFDLEIEDSLKLLLYYHKLKHQNKTDDFYNWIQKNFGSHPGFISMFPYEKYAFKKALFETEPDNNKKYCQYTMAVAMLLTYAIEKDSNCATDSYQRDFEDNISEYCSSYGYFNYDEDDE